MTLQALLPLLSAVTLSFAGASGPQASSPSGAALDLHLAAAQRAQRVQDYSTAEQEYRAAITLDPGFAELHMNLGLVYQLQGRTEDAIVELQRSLKLKPDLAGANLMLGIDLCRLGEGAKAIPLLRAAIQREPNRIEAYSWLATAQEISGDLQAELLTIKDALSRRPQDVDLLYLEGHVYERLGKKEVLAINGANSRPLFAERLLGESYANSSEWPSAVIHFENAIAGASKASNGLHVELGEVLLRAGKIERATREFHEELGIDPKNVRAMVRRGEVKLAGGELDEGLQDWSEALLTDATYTRHLLGLAADVPGPTSSDPLSTVAVSALVAMEPRLRSMNSPAAHLALAYLAKQYGNGARAADGTLPDPGSPVPRAGTCSEPGLKAAMHDGRISAVADCGLPLLNSRRSEASRVLIASSLLELGRYGDSLKVLAALPRGAGRSTEVSYLRARCYEELSTAAYLKLFLTDPNSFRLHQLMGDLASAREDDTKAIEEYRAALAIKPSVPNLHYSLGHILWKNSDIDAARTEFNAELAITPGHAGALHDLGETYLMERNPAKALSFLERAVAAGGQGPDLDRDLGTAYAQLGDFRNAEKKYNLALSSDRDGSIHFKLAKAYQALGETAKASQAFTVAENLNRGYHAKLQEDLPRRRSIEQ